MNATTNGMEGPERLESVIGDAYKVFRRDVPPAFPLDVCLGCCMSVDLEREMRELPLRELTAQHFYEYNTSAKSAVQPALEILYLLPRMLELIAEGAAIHHSTELYLDRVGRCPAGSFGAEQQRVLDRFALGCFARAISEAQTWIDDPITLLLTFDIAGVDIAPLLDQWARCEGPEATLHYVDATYWHFWPERAYCNAFAADRPKFLALIRSWMLDAANRQRFTDKLMRPGFLAWAQRQDNRGCMPFGTMVDAVFDQLTQ